MFTNVILFYLLLAIAVVAASLFIIWQDKKQPCLSIILKIVASFCFIALGVFSVYFSDTNSLAVFFVILGLVASLVGDALLGVLEFDYLEKHKVISSGMIAFSVAQILYYVSLVLFAGFSWWSLGIAGAITLSIAFSEKLLKLEYGKVRVFTLVYTFLLALTLGQSVMNVAHLGGDYFSVLMVIGFALFFLSDLVLAFIYFKKEYPSWFVYLNYFLYYAGQILIASSLFFLK